MYFAVYKQSDAADCLKIILYKVSRQAAEVSTQKNLLCYCEETNENDVWHFAFLFEGLQGRDDSRNKLLRRPHKWKNKTILDFPSVNQRYSWHNLQCGEQSSEFLISMWTCWANMPFITTFVFPQQNSFERMFEMKTCTGDNMVYCNECNKKTEATNVSFDLKMKTQTTSRSILILELKSKYSVLKDRVFDDVSCVIQRCEKVKAPQILILLLKRFGFDHNTKSRFKSDCCVEVPCDLKLEARKSYFYLWFSFGWS